MIGALAGRTLITRLAPIVALFAAGFAAGSWVGGAVRVDRCQGMRIDTLERLRDVVEEREAELRTLAVEERERAETLRTQVDEIMAELERHRLASIEAREAFRRAQERASELERATLAQRRVADREIREAVHECQIEAVPSTVVDSIQRLYDSVYDGRSAP